MIFKNRSFHVLIDMIMIALAFLAATLARYASFSKTMIAFGQWNGLALLWLVYLLVLLFYQADKPLIERSRWDEVRTVSILNLYMAATLTLALYLSKSGEQFPRSLYLLFFIFNVFDMVLGRMYLKRILSIHYQKHSNRRKLLVAVNEENVGSVLEQLRQSTLYAYEIEAVVVLGEQGDIIVCDYIPEILTIDSQTELEEFLKRNVVDEILINAPKTSKEYIMELLRKLMNMGICAHVATDTFGLTEQEKVIERFGSYHVLTYSPRIFEPAELIFKRCMDMVGGLVGAFLAIVIGIFVAPAIYLESPGPVVFKQVRIGRNGRRFYIYKFRSMYMDAEKRKQELMAQNEMNGFMFKIKDDPRITKVGKFIRKTSLDEFPQFFNVLKGDMSLVGTRPPTEDEFLQYEEHHKRRLSLKPGITGMWQVSGRSDIQDFEDVVRLDLDYIDHWSIWLDIRLLFQTVFVEVLGKGGR